jgi:hypothetical protein
LKTKFWTVGLACLLVFCVVPASALASSIGGVVTGGGGPLANVYVCAEGSTVECSGTGANGEYKIENLAADNYFVEFFPNQGNYLTAYWEEGGTVGTNASPIALKAGEDRTGIGGDLPLGGEISGTVTVAGGGPLRRVSVCANEAGGGVNCGQSDEDGKYALNAVIPGTYKIEFSGTPTVEFGTKWWNEKTSEGEAEEVAIASGGKFTADAALVPTQGVVEGTVSVEGVDAFPAEACLYELNAIKLSCAQTSFNGRYILGAPAGEYLLGFEAEGLFQWSGGATEFEGATPVTLVTGQATPYDADLFAPPAIAGQVTEATSETPIVGAEICATETTTQAKNCTTPVSEGKYVLPLSAGTYEVVFRAEGFAGKRYPSVVVSDRQVNGVSAALEPSGALFGRLTDAFAEPLEGAAACALEADGTVVDCDVTDSSGQWEISELPLGEYKLRFTDSGYLTQYMEGKETLAEAETVPAEQFGGRSWNATLFAEEVPQIAISPEIEGVGKVGETLTCEHGLWFGAPETFTYAYEWLSENVAIAGVNGAEYTLTAAEAGTEVECSVVATNTSGSSIPARSEPIEVDALPQRQLLINRAGDGSGTVTSSPGGISCGATCDAPFAEGTVVTLVATADAGSEFTGWSGDCAGSVACDVTLGTADAEAIAHFAKIAPPVHQLSIAKTGEGTGRVTSAPAGIDCGVNCAESVADGSTITLTATADSDSEFTGWSGACSGTGTCVVTVEADTSVVANFAKKATDNGGGSDNGGKSDGGSSNPPSTSPSNPPASTPPSSTPPATTKPAPKHPKKPLQCKKGFHKAKHKGKVRCVKVKPKHHHKVRPTGLK